MTAAIAATKSAIHPQEISLACSDGTVLAAQSWKTTPPHAPKIASSPVPRDFCNMNILCLHGWLDNCRSFYQLAPAVAAASDADRGYHVVALDLPGHGRSAHKSVDAPPMVQAEMAFYVSEAIDRLYEQGIWEKRGDEGMSVTLMGHSLGAGISTLYAAAFPHQVKRMILLDGAGFLPREASDVALHVYNHIRRRKLALRKRNNTERKGYPTLEAAIQQRLQSVESMPGNQTMSSNVARELVLRAMHLDKFTGEELVQDETLPLIFQHDSRFAWPSIQYYTQEQNEGIFRTLGGSRVDTCILLAVDGWPFPKDVSDKAFELIRPRMLRTLPGSHYLHADPETAPAVLDSVLEFLSTKRDC